MGVRNWPVDLVYCDDMISDKRLSVYTVESICLNTHRMLYSNVTATSVKDALAFERGYFGEPFFRVLRAYPKQNDRMQHDTSNLNR